MTLKTGWLHEAENDLGTWLHEADDWHHPLDHHAEKEVSLGVKQLWICPSTASMRVACETAHP